MRKYLKNLAYFLCFIVLELYICGCKGHTDPMPEASNSSYVPGTTCVLNEMKFFSLDTDSLMGGVQLKYSSGNKLSNVLYYQKGQQPGDNGYTTLTYNTDETLKETITYSPKQVFTIAFISVTFPGSSSISKYFYTDGKLAKIEHSDNSTNTVFIDSLGSGSTFVFTFGYYADGKLQYQLSKYAITAGGINMYYSDSTLYESYVYNRPQYVSDFTRYTRIYPADSSQNSDFKSSIFQKNIYDTKGNKIKTEFLHFKIDSVSAAVYGKAATEAEALADSVENGLETTFDITKPNVAYAFRFLNPQNPDDIDINLATGSKSGCLILTNNYTFNASNLPDKLNSTFSFDGSCGDLGKIFDKLNEISGKALPVNNSYTRYYYTGCK